MTNEKQLIECVKTQRQQRAAALRSARRQNGTPFARHVEKCLGRCGVPAPRPASFEAHARRLREIAHGLNLRLRFGNFVCGEDDALDSNARDCLAAAALYCRAAQCL